MALTVSCALTVGVRPGSSQTTREALITDQLAQRAREAAPEPMSSLERTFDLVENTGIVERVTEGLGGFYPRFGGISPAGGFAGGLGYRRHLGRDIQIQTGYTASLRGYQLADARLTVPTSGDRVTFSADVTHRDYPQERYFGIGADSILGDRTHYALNDTQLVAGTTLQPVAPLRLHAAVGYLRTAIGRGTGSFASIEDRFTEGDTPGLSSQPSFVTWNLGVGVDFRDVPANARAGGHYTAEVTSYADRGQQQFSFRRYTLEGVQYLPFFDKRRAVVLRAQGILTDPEAGHRVPFYLMPTLGGPETLRGFREFRFRDANMLLLTAEYRWEVFAALDMALFTDGGMFAARPGALSLHDLRASHGIGFRFSTVRRFLTRVDIGTGPEGTRVFLRFVPAF